MKCIICLTDLIKFEPRRYWHGTDDEIDQCVLGDYELKSQGKFAWPLTLDITFPILNEKEIEEAVRFKVVKILRNIK